MNIEQIKRSIAAGAFKDAESIWMSGVNSTPASDDIHQTLAAFVKSGKADLANTLARALVDAHDGSDNATQLRMAKSALLGVPQNAELRQQVIALYKDVYSGTENFDVIFKSAGLEGNQTPRRAIRTIDVCLQIKPGDFMSNKFEKKIIRIKHLEPTGEYEFTTGRDIESLDAKLLTDDYELLADNDFRVIFRKDRARLEDMIAKSPADVLISLAVAHKGEVDVDRIKSILIPKFFPKSKWSSWWGKARTAAKKNQHIVIEGRPAVVSYHEQGVTLEEEYTPSLDAAREPAEFLSVLRGYLADAKKRAQEPNQEFAGRIMNRLAEMAIRYSSTHPADSMEIVLMIEEGIAMGAQAPEKQLPEIPELIAKMPQPAKVIATFKDRALWTGALEALKANPQAANHYRELLYLAPIEYLDTIAADLAEFGDTDSPDQAVQDAMNDALNHIDLICWAWNGPATPLKNPPEQLSMLLKILDVLMDIDHRFDAPSDVKRHRRQIIRNTLAARSYERYQQTLAEIDEHMASVIKTKIERTDGLAQAVTDEMVSRLRKDFFGLFVKKKISPWLNENIIFTSEAALHAYEEELRVLKEEKMPANAKQIGEAAEQGDLRENADWQAAIEERDMLVNRARKMNEELAKARIISETDISDDFVSIGSKVVMRRVADGQTFELNFLGPWDSDIENRIYSYTTRLAQNLMGKEKGTIVEMELAGIRGEYEIADLSSAI